MGARASIRCSAASERLHAPRAIRRLASARASACRPMARSDRIRPAASCGSSPALIVLVIAGAFAYRIFEKESDALGAGAERRVPRGADAARRRLLPGRGCGSRGPTSPAIRRSGRRRASRRRRRRAPRSSSSTRPASSNRTAWNAPLDDAESQDRARACSCAARRARSTSVGAIWAPKYRQATFGAFLTSEDNARRALDFAYRDVLAAYEAFLRAGARRTGRSSSPRTARAASI